LAERPRAADTDLEDDHIVEALQAHHHLSHEALPDVIIFDCRVFQDPEGQQHQEPHLGFHPTMQAAVMRHKAFSRFMRELRRVCDRSIAAQRRTGEALPHLQFVFFCNHGRHRSLACMTLVRLIADVARWQLGKVLHLGHWDMGRTCHACAECMGTGLAGDREWLRKQMVARWEQSK